ncbi:MAG: PAS domain S-box protein, partial [Geminicoccaceae bacterium]
MVRQHARRLTRHYALLLCALAVPLLLLVIALAWQQFIDQRRDLLEELAGRARTERVALEPVLQAAVSHVDAMREFIENRLAGQMPQSPTALRPALTLRRHADGIEGVFLDQFADTDQAAQIGNVLADPAVLDADTGERRELDTALETFALMRHAHLSAPQLHWSYYLSASGDFVSMFPFAPSDNFIAAGGYSSIRALIAGWLGYDVFLSGTPARNPEHRPYWTGVYQDAGGAGPMISYAAPVYADGRFMGVVGTDILLDFLSAFLGEIDWPLGGVWIVSDSGGMIVARREDGATADPALPPALAAMPLPQLLADTGGFRSIDGQLILTQRLADSPFSLVYSLPEEEIAGLFLPRVKPYALILAALMLTLLCAYLLLQRQFIRPALALVRHIQDESEGIARASAVPAIWRPWFAAVSDAFEHGRILQGRLAASEAQLRAAAESIPDGLAIFDAEDRLVFHNSSYPENLSETVRATMALGKRWSDWGREAEALGPIYHPEMGEHYLQQRIADRAADSVDREHRLIDGRWVRTRESRMPDGGRVLLTNDTTLERRLRQERSLIAAAMAQVGDSIEITDDAYHLLYVNPAFTRLTGFTAEEALGRTPGELIRSDQHPPEFFAELDRRTRSGQVWQGRIISRHKSGRLLYQDATISPVFDESGALLCFCCAKRDVSDRIRAEAALEESRHTYAAVLEAALDCFVSIDSDGRIIEFNPAAEQTFGYSAGEVRGRELHELLIPAALRGAHVAGMRRYLETGESRILGRRLEVTALRKDGTTIPVELVVAATRQEDRPTFMAYMRDLSEQKRTEAALRASEARFLAAAASMPDGLVILDAEDRIVFFNNRHPEMLPPVLREGLALGVRFGDWIRESRARGPIYHPDMGPDYAERRLATRREGFTEREHKHVDGRWVRVREAPMPDGGRVILTTDITERREAEARFLAAAESIPDGLAILDAEDRFVFYNSRYPAHLTKNLREVLKLGQRFEDWIKAGTARGPIYHPDMGEDWIERRLTLHAKEDSEHEHKLIDGRWCRLRESRMPHGGRVILTSNVTERRQREEQLSLMGMAVDQVGDAVEITDAGGRYTYVNRAFERLTGFASSEVVGRSPREVLAGGESDGIYDAIERHLGEGGSWQGLIVAQRRDGEAILLDTTISPLRDARGRITHHVAVKRDVTEQEKAEAAVRASEARYRAVVDTQREFIARITPDGRLTFVNDAYCRYYGRTREELLGRRFNDFTATLPADRTRDEVHLASLTPDSPSRAIELRRVLPDGRLRWVQWVDTALFDEEGRLVEIQAVGRDITEQRESEQALLKSEASYRALVETQTEFILRQRPDGILTFVNEAYGRYIGLPREQLLRGDWNDFALIIEEDRDRHTRHLAALTPEQPTASIELRALLPDGTDHWELWVDTGIFDRDGTMIEIQSVGRDVTERKRSELALRDSEARYRTLVETQTEFVLRQLPEGRLTFVNEAYCRYVGKPREYILSEEFNGLDMMVPEDRPRFEAHLRSLMPDNPTAIMETRAVLPDGSFRWERWIDTGVFDDAGELVELQSTGRDITDQKKGELALRESEARYRAVVEGQTEFILRIRPDGVLTFVNDAYCRYRGLDRATLLDGFNDVIHYPVEEQERIEAAWAGLTPARPTVTYEVCEDKDGRPSWEEWTDTAVFDSDGRVVEYQAIGRDITARKLAEQSLRESEARYRALIETQSEFIIRRRPDGLLTFVNEAFCRYTGRTREEMLSPGWNDYDLIAPEDRERHDRFVASLTPEHPVGTIEIAAILPDGRRRTEQWSSVGVFDDAGKVVEIQAVGRDVTERRQAEHALSESEARFRLIAESVPLPIAITALDRYCVLFVNAKGREVFGLDAGETDGDRIEGIWVDSAARTEIARRIVRDGGADQAEVRMRRADGSEFDAIMSARPLNYGGESAVLGVITDITERRRMEEALRESEARLAALMDNAPLVVHLKDRAGHYLLANPESAKIFHRLPAEVIGRTAHDVFPPDEADLIERHHAEVLAIGTTLFHEEYQPSLEAYQWSMVIRFPIRDAHGNIAVVGCFALDITERKRAEAALKASEARLAAFMENAPVGMYLKDLEGRYLMANSEMGKLFGRPAEAMIGRTADDAFPPEAAATIARHNREVIETGRPLVTEEALPDRTDYAWSMIIRFPIRDEASAITHIGGFNLDITRSKLAEAEVKASAMRFRAIAEVHPTPMIITRLVDRQVLFANRAYSDTFRVASEDLNGFDRGQLYADPADREAIYADIARGDRIDGREIVMRTAFGDLFPSVLTARGIDYEGGAAVVMSFLDLSALKRAEAALRASEQRFRVIAEAHPMPLVIVRRQDGRLMFANQPFRSLFRLTGKNLERLQPEEFYAEAGARERFLTAMQAEGMVEGLEQVLRRIDGSTFPGATTSRLIEYEGQPAFVTSVVDLTERRAAEAEIQKQRETLHQSEKLAALGALLAGVAHELNNPLSVVVGYSSMLEELAQDAASRQRAARVHAAAERCARIVKTFLAMARSRPPQHGPVRLAEV